MDIDLTGKVALVTGAEGIGRAAALAFAAHGARVAVLSRTRKDIDAVVGDIERSGGEGLALEGDVSNANDMQHAAAAIRERWDRLDIVFANAGINGVWAPLDELDVAEWRKTIDINLTGTFLTVKYALPLLKVRGGAVIITSSVNGTRMFSNTGATAYASSKAAQVAFAQMIALELAPHKIRVNVVCPGAIETNIEENTEREDLDEIQYPVSFPKGAIPLTGGAPARAEQVADLVVFLASDAARHITGTPVWIDGAQSLFQG
jgi:NAD(P)-dependent dehydrogenase (short-subunit alcohol dehydrogenase family)